MKLNKLTSAVSISFAALALTACGSDNNTSQVPSIPAPGTETPAPTPEPETPTPTPEPETPAPTPEPETPAPTPEPETPAPTPEPETPAPTPEIESGPTSDTILEKNTEVLGFDPSKVSSTVTTHYVRHGAANFDYASNPDATKNANSGTTGQADLNQQNPELTNYYMGAEKEPGSNKVYGMNYLGEYYSSKRPNLDIDNVVTEYVAIDRNGVTQTKTRPADKADRPTIQAENFSNVQVGYTGNQNPNKVEVIEIDNTLDIGKEEDFKSLLESLATATPVVYDSGLIGYNATVGNSSGRILSPKLYLGTLERNGVVPDQSVVTINDNTTRVFGKNYNSYEGDATKGNTTLNSYRAIGNQIGTTVLNDVQYGRLTANLNTLISASKESGDTSIDTKIYRQFEKHQTPDTVDSYYYRGTNATTIEQMNAVKANAAKLDYYGHALTYGISPFAKKADVPIKPNAFGLDVQNRTIGNFVHATFDTSTGKVNGRIYNLLNDNVTNLNNKVGQYQQQDLVKFEGDVFGNTVAGSATNISQSYNGTTGSFTGSFYGSQANELGGQISSVTRENGYGSASWGAVFGAKREIPVVTPPAPQPQPKPQIPSNSDKVEDKVVESTDGNVTP